MELTLVHLKTALEYKKPKYILLEVFSPILDNKATLAEGGPKGNLLMDLDGIHNYADKFSALCTLVDWKSMPEGMFQLCRPAHRWDRWNIKRNRKIKVSNTHGYEAASTAKSFATGTKRVEDIESACRAAYSNHELEELADYNRDALVEFLDITKQNGINVVLYKAPTMRTDDFGRVNEVFAIAKDYDNVVLCQDTRCDMLEMGLELEDFYDDGHLNKRGGEKFTYYFGNLLSAELDLPIDWDRVYAYKGEKIECLADGQFMYSMENYCTDTLYQFELYKENTLVEKIDFSENNYYVCEIDISNSTEYKLICSMIPTECKEQKEACEDYIRVEFMKQNQCIIE